MDTIYSKIFLLLNCILTLFVVFMCAYSVLYNLASSNGLTGVKITEISGSLFAVGCVDMMLILYAESVKMRYELIIVLTKKSQIPGQHLFLTAKLFDTQNLAHFRTFFLVLALPRRCHIAEKKPAHTTQRCPSVRQILYLLQFL